MVKYAFYIVFTIIFALLTFSSFTSLPTLKPLLGCLKRMPTSDAISKYKHISTLH